MLAVGSTQTQADPGSKACHTTAVMVGSCSNVMTWLWLHSDSNIVCTRYHETRQSITSVNLLWESQPLCSVQAAAQHRCIDAVLVLSCIPQDGSQDGVQNGAMCGFALYWAAGVVLSVLSELLVHPHAGHAGPKATAMHHSYFWALLHCKCMCKASQTADCHRKQY